MPKSETTPCPVRFKQEGDIWIQSKGDKDNSPRFGVGGTFDCKIGCPVNGRRAEVFGSGEDELSANVQRQLGQSKLNCEGGRIVSLRIDPKRFL